MDSVFKKLKYNYDTKNGTRIPKDTIVEIAMEMEQQNYTMVIYNGLYLAVQKDALEDVDM